MNYKYIKITLLLCYFSKKASGFVGKVNVGLKYTDLYIFELMKMKKCSVYLKNTLIVHFERSREIFY